MAQLFGKNCNVALNCSVKEFLCSAPSNLYTTMRMSSSGSVLELEMHLDRIGAMGEEREKIKSLLEELHRIQPRDLRITLIRTQTNGFQLIYEDMPKMELKSCQVEVRLAHRQNVQEKNSQWVKDRIRLEEEKAKESNEVILMDEEGRLFEGLSSNFFVIRADGCIQTAPLDRVLAGTVMKRVLQDANIKVVFEFPRIENVGEWKGAFITSTSRLVLPIHQIILPDSQVVAIPLNEEVQRLRERIQLTISL